MYMLTPPQKSFIGENRISVSLMYIYAVPSLSHRILESWIHGSPSDSKPNKFQLKLFRLNKEILD